MRQHWIFSSVISLAHYLPPVPIVNFAISIFTEFSYVFHDKNIFLDECTFPNQQVKSNAITLSKFEFQEKKRVVGIEICERNEIISERSKQEIGRLTEYCKQKMALNRGRRSEKAREFKSDMQFQDCETSHASVRVTRRVMKFSWKQRSLNGKKETGREMEKGQRGKKKNARVEAKGKQSKSEERGVKRQKSREAR